MSDTNWLLPTVTTDATLNDSDKLVVVPTAKVWEIQSVYVELISTASVGNRQLEVQIRDASGNPLARAFAGVVQAANLTRNYTFAANVQNQTAFVDSGLQTALPCISIAAAFDIRIFDNAAIDAAADDMTVRVLAIQRDA